MLTSPLSNDNSDKMLTLNIYGLYTIGDEGFIMVRKVIIPAAGLGTRLFPATKEQPKEMLPIFARSSNGSMLVKPVVQLVFEQLHDAGLREFCYVVGRGKRGIEDHFTPDIGCIKNLAEMGKNGQATDLEEFYEKLNTSTSMWVNQPEAKGFGNAVLMAQPFVQNESCLVHAGDSCIISKNMDYLKKLLEANEKFNADAAFLVLEIEKPKQYGIVEGEEVEPGIIKVKAVVEKPEKPKTNLAIMAMYVFHPVIFKALEATTPGKNGEIQLTDAIQKLVDWGLKVYAVKLDKNYSHLDIGSPERYWEALELSYQQFCKRPTP
jgi:UTP--glucose-1-phosphate uridylyltransferase